MTTTHKIFYTDGHEVIVTDTTFIVKKKEFKLPGIKGHGLTRLEPHRAPGLFTFILGLSLVLIGAYELLPAALASDIKVLNRSIGIHTISMAAGSLMAFAGLMMIVLVKPKYAVRISTAEGDLNAVVSRHMEYIRQIIDGLNRAFMSRGVRA